MGQLLVPEWATQSKESFTEWFCLIYSQLYEQPEEKKILKKNIKFYPFDDRINITEKIMHKVNLTMFGKNAIPNYRFKRKKVACDVGDVLAVTCHVLYTEFDITYQEIAEIIGCKSHCTVLYYVKNCRGRCNAVKKYRKSYEQLLKILKDERLIPVIEKVQPESKRVLHTILHGEQL